MDYTKSLAAEWTWRHRVCRYRIHDPAPNWFREQHSEEYATLMTNPGGVLVAESVEGWEYDVMECGDAILTSATSLDPTNKKELTRFVNSWGIAWTARVGRR